MYNLNENLEYCGEIVSDLTGLLIYSHVPVVIISLLFGFYILVKNKKSLLSNIFFYITIFFSLWSVLDLMIWLFYHNSHVLMFAWAPIEFISAILFILVLYFQIVFIKQKDVSNKYKFLALVLLIPYLVFMFTTINLVDFDIQECIATEGSFMINYSSYLKLFLSVLILLLPIRELLKKTTKRSSYQVLLMTLGSFAFVFSFVISGQIASSTQDFIIEVYGLFAMLIFVVTLFYLVVKFNLLNVKLLLAQFFMIVLIALVGSQLFYAQGIVSVSISIVTLTLVLIFSFFLIRNVKQVDIQKEKLALANINQQSLLHFITHQVKGFFTKSRNIFSGIIEEDYGDVSEKIKEVAKVGLVSDTKGVETIQSILRASDLQNGTTEFNKKKADLAKIVKEVTERLKSDATEKGLQLHTKIPDSLIAHIDELKLQEVIKNIIDNSILYTPSGSIDVSLSEKNGKAIFIVKDTGIGFDPEDKRVMFTQGGKGKDSLSVNVDSTGYGLYVAKKIVDEHKGKIWGNSEGKGKGSEFGFEIPV